MDFKEFLKKELNDLRKYELDLEKDLKEMNLVLADLILDIEKNKINILLLEDMLIKYDIDNESRV